MAFQTIKTSILKRGKICIFPKGLLHRFGKKFLNFLYFYFILGKISKENVFDDILNRKKTYLDNNKVDFENTKN